ncbi:LSU ribosomal protein L21p [Fibrobacteres bacterium R8-0-B4]
MLLPADDSGNISVGSPTVAGATVSAKVVGHGKDKKVLVIKKKRRKDYKRKNGHRQKFTQIEIVSINA